MICKWPTTPFCGMLLVVVIQGCALKHITVKMHIKLYKATNLKVNLAVKVTLVFNNIWNDGNVACSKFIWSFYKRKTQKSYQLWGDNTNIIEEELACVSQVITWLVLKQI